MITFCVICYGCRGKQINRALSQLHFSSSHRAHISQTLISLFYFCAQASLLKNIWCMRTPVSYQNLMRNAASECTWGIFKSIFHVIALPSIPLIPLHIMFSVCLVNWPQMPGFSTKKRNTFSQLQCAWQAPESEVIIYLICSPNKLLTLIFVSQHVSSWFVIESQ